MSVLAGKHVLLVASDTSTALQSLKPVLVGQEMLCQEITCSTLNVDFFTTNHIDILFLDLATAQNECKEAMRTLAHSQECRDIPIITVVSDVDAEIQAALNLGAADYILQGEDTYLMLDKIRALFSVSESFSDTSVIDITPAEPSLSVTGTKVYVVEDDPLLQNLLSIRLSKSQFPYEFSSDGKQAITNIKVFKPDVIILDLMLPGMNGLDLLKDIRSDEALKHVPVIIFSNRDNPDDRKQADDLGISGYYIKAMTDLTDLILKIESLQSTS